ncbi:TatD family deoxyribonuclease [Salinicola endophyticus]|uniref:TatD family deoxyribonuclease n=1 Tax=Salinicola endophyticus TaxID=1949083 RepID=A0ABY8FJH7_9GAMM|nr:TatD family hydrolase [Salinicola endophyticus]WFF42965.1 TatD family deoxyribonuclease [Salinicola endophyticus]
MLFDAHCHLDFAAFDADREAVLARAQAVGVRRFMVPATTRARWPAVSALAARDDVVIGLGLHPYFVATHRDEDLDALGEALAQRREVVAVGECGIDARFAETLPRQWQLFEAQLQLAKHYRLPLVIHCVHANDQVAKRLRQLALPAGGLIHAFSGSPQQAHRFVDLGYHLGLGGAATHTRAQRLQRAIASLPDDAFVLETDSPDMPPAGRQGQRNEPANLTEVLTRVAALRRCPEAEVAAQAYANTCRLFACA